MSIGQSSLITWLSGARSEWQARRNLAGRQYVQQVVVILAAGLLIAGTILVGTYVLGKPKLLVGVLGGPIFALFTIRWPEVGILSLVGITGGLVDTDWLPILRFGPVSVHIPEIMLAVLLGLLVLRATAHRGFRLHFSPLHVPLLLFMAMAVISMFNAVALHGTDANQALRFMRIIVQWSLFIPVVGLIHDRRSLRRLINGLWVLASVLALAAVFRQYLPFLHPAILPVHKMTLTTAGVSFESVSRQFFVGDPVLFITLPLTLSHLAIVHEHERPTRWVWGMIGLLCLLSFWLLYSFQRNFWVCTAFEVALLGAILRNTERLRLVKRGVLWLTVLAIYIAVFQAVQPGQADRVRTAANNRIVSLLRAPTRADSSTTWRVAENHYALRQIARNPALGVGLASTYRPPLENEDAIQDVSLGAYLHNAYLWLAVMMGLAGLLPFLALCLIYLYRALAYGRTIEDTTLRAVCLGFGVGFAGAMVSNIVAPFFLQRWSLTIYATMMGITEVSLRLEQRHRKTR